MTEVFDKQSETAEKMSEGFVKRRALIAMIVMGGTSLGAQALKPTQRISELLGDFQLELIVPKNFADWRLDANTGRGVVNPQQVEMLNQLYSQILTRTYVNSSGQQVMLSIAYGNNQRDGLQMHYPEVCYPAQGFQLLSNKPVDLKLGQSRILARRLETLLGNQRHEAVTYWTVIGERAFRGGFDKKIIEMQYGFRGLIPDGLLFRVSSIDSNSSRAFDIQSRFAEDIIESIPLAHRKRIAGSNA